MDIIPDPTSLVESVREWLAGQAGQRMTFYSAEEGEEFMEDVVQAAPLPPRLEEVRGMTPPPVKAKDAPKKRVTTAVLSEQLSGLVDLIPAINAQISELQKGQQELQHSLALHRSSPPPRASQMPVSAAVQGVASFAKMMGSPPRTKPLPGTGALLPAVTPGLNGDGTLQEYSKETSPVASSDPFTKAMLEQSKALMSLVAHMQQGGDPLLGGQASSSTGTFRGSVGREKLQKELASKSGAFFLAVLQNATKRLKPAHPRPQSIEDIAATDFSMISYLERFGGFGQYKELGLIQYADLNGARGYLALLMVGIDQANLDGNRWELAYRMMLVEEPPAQLWSYRSQGFDPPIQKFLTARSSAVDNGGFSILQRDGLYSDQTAKGDKSQESMAVYAASSKCCAAKEEGEISQGKGLGKSGQHRHLASPGYAGFQFPPSTFPGYPLPSTPMSERPSAVHGRGSLERGMEDERQRCCCYEGLVSPDDPGGIRMELYDGVSFETGYTPGLSGEANESGDCGADDFNNDVNLAAAPVWSWEGKPSMRTREIGWIQQVQ